MQVPIGNCPASALLYNENVMRVRCNSARGLAPENGDLGELMSTGMKTPLLGIAAGMLFVGMILVVLVYFDVHEQLVELLEWIDAQGAMAAVFFILLMAAVVVLLAPGIFLTTGAGFVFGVIEGTVLVVAGTVIGASLAFLIARHLFGELASRFIISRSNLQIVSDEMARHDLKVVMLTRLIPFFPSKISNYFFGLTRFTFKGFVMGSLIGFIPFSLHNVYLGSITADLASLSRGEVARSPLQWAFYGLGFVATIVALLYFNNLARRALAAYSQESGNVQGGKPVPEAETAARPAKGSS